MKKALIVSNSSGLVTLFLKNDVELLRHNGYLIDVACNTEYPDANTDTFFNEYCNKIFNVSFPIRNLDFNLIIKSYRQLAGIVKTGEYNVIHCHSTIAAVLARQCAKKYRKNGLKVIYTSHGFPFYKGNDGKKAKLFKIIEKHYSRYTDGIITICQEDYNNARQMHCKNVKLMHGVGVNIDRFIDTRINRADYRLQLGFKSSDKVVLAIGELNTNKNHQIIVKALNKLKDNNLILAICGREVTEAGKKAELQTLADSLHVRILFLGFRKDIPEICHSADIGVLSSFKEGLGLSGIEMLASGIPVAGSNRQGIKDYVVDGETGYLADPNDENSFALAIRNCLAMSNNENLSEKCISMANKFSTKQSRDVINLMYKEIGVY